MIGPGKAIDTNRWAVLCPNLLGSCYGTEFKRLLRKEERRSAHPSITTRDQAHLIENLLNSLGVSSPALVTGGSLGGMVALEWAASFPSRTRAAVVFAAPAAHTAWAIGWNHVQRRALEAGGPEAGLAVARMVGMLTYRTPEEFESRFGRQGGADEPFAVQSYLSRHGAKLVARFDAKSYRTLLAAMDAHDVGRGRGGRRGRARARPARALTGVGIPGDGLYPEERRRGLGEARPARRTRSSARRTGTTDSSSSRTPPARSSRRRSPRRLRASVLGRGRRQRDGSLLLGRPRGDEEARARHAGLAGGREVARLDGRAEDGTARARRS